MLQRILHGIATLAGVVVLVFGLFHLVGGGAARFALDELAPATERAAYDARRGFDRPLVMGRWQRDGSLGDTSFDRDAGLWRADPRVLYRRALGPLPGRIGLPPGAPPYRVPLAEPLDPGRSYQLMVTYRTADESKAVCRVTSVDDPGTAIAESPMPPTRGWQVVTLPLDPLPGGGARSAWIEVRDADIEVATLSLDRRLNSPFDGQFAHFAGRVAHMDLGVSQRTGQPVRELLREGLGPTLALMIPIALMGLAVPLGMARKRAGHWGVRGMVVCLCSIHVVVLVLAMQFLFTMKWRWLPLWGLESARYLVLPVLTGGLMLAAQTALARGGRPGDVPAVVRAAVPVLVTLDLLLETLCGISGIGYAAVLAAQGGDVDVLQGVILVGACAWIGLKVLWEIGAFALARRSPAA